MLTFEFTGVEGRMTGSETLTSGMVGKTVQILFDDSWTNLTKTLVFRAGHIQTTVPFGTSPVVIPANVLAHPFQKLFVGVYGTDQYGNLVIPTLMAEGPMIRYGATAEELPADGNLICRKLQAQIGNLNHLQTNAKSSLVAAINELASRQGGAGMSKEAIALLITILRHALYEGDQSDNIDALEEALNEASADPGQGETPEIPDDPVTLTHITAVYTGGSVPVGTDINSLVGLTVTAHYSDGSSATVTGYGIGGAITKAGSNTLSIVYNDVYTTITVTGYAVEKTLTSISASYTGDSVPVGTATNTLYPYLTVTAHYSDGSSELALGYGLSGQIANAGDNVITVMYGGKTTTFTVVGIVESNGVIAHWDFTTGSWVDTVGGLEAVHTDDVTMDASGAKLTSTTAYVQVLVNPDGVTPINNIIEIKFGQMNLTYANVALRLAMTGNGVQPMASGLYYKGTWRGSNETATELEDVNYFSGKTLTIKTINSGSYFYLDEQFLFQKDSGLVPSHLSIGSSGSSTPGALVESITVRKEV